MHYFGHLEPHTIGNQQRPIMKKSNPNPKIQIQLLGHWMHHFGHLESHTISKARPIMKKTEKIQSKSNSKFWNQQINYEKNRTIPIQIQIQLLESTKANYEKKNPNPTFGPLDISDYLKPHKSVINKGQL